MMKRRADQMDPKTYLGRTRQRVIAHALNHSMAAAKVTEEQETAIVLKFSEKLHDHNGRPASSFDSFFQIKVEKNQNEE
jgi:hypothetical protein